MELYIIKYGLKISWKISLNNFGYKIEINLILFYHDVSPPILSY